MSNLPIKSALDDSGAFYPESHERAIVDDNGTSLETKLQMVKTPVLTLNSAPTSSTLTHTEGGVTYTFKVGDEVRVKDTEKGTAEGNYYVFYTLKDKSNNTAYWEESGSGGGTSGTSFYTPTLSAAPTSSTTTYTKDGVTVDFVIGQFARVADATMDTGYKFYQLADLSNGVAAWQEMGTPLERVTINLSANANLAALRSAAPTVTVTSTKSAGTIFSGAWTGDALKLKVEPGDTYTVSVEEVEGFATPASQTYNAELEGVNSVTFNYATVEWSVAITSNQSSDATIAALTGTAEWTYNGNSYSESGLANGDMVYIPTGVTPTFTIADTTGYKKTVTVSSPDITATYETEVVTVSVGTDSIGVTAEGQVITINGVAYTVGASGVVVAKVPMGTQYSVSANTKSGYTTPASQSFTASQTSQSVTMTYIMVRIGAFLYTTDGGLYNASQWTAALNAGTVSNNDLIGIAVLTNDYKFMIALAPLNNAKIWNEQKACTGLTAITTQSAAEAHYTGKADTAVMAQSNNYGTSTSYVTGRTIAYTFNNGKKGYLPSLGEAKIAYSEKSTINSLLTACGRNAMEEEYCWTSTYKGQSGSSYYFYRFSFSDGAITQQSVGSWGGIWPFGEY